MPSLTLTDPAVLSAVAIATDDGTACRVVGGDRLVAGSGELPRSRAVEVWAEQGSLDLAEAACEALRARGYQATSRITKGGA